MNNKTDIVKIQQEITSQISKKEVLTALVNTTFKGLEVQLMKRALMEGMMRGFKFEDFLQKNVYAIPFSNTYSLVTSIDYARKIGMRSGVVGKSKPEFEFDDDGKIISCTITIKRKVADYVGEYSDTVYFEEYTTGRNLWKSKPKTMIAKVAEMHALRMACPEELSQIYIEEDYEQEASLVVDTIPQEIRSSISEAKDLKTLKTIYKTNEGLGKEFAKLVTDKKEALIELQNANS